MSIAQQPDDSAQKRKQLVGLVGATCVVVLMTCVPNFEGRELIGYKDPIGIVTACDGHTGREAQLGRKYTPAECDKLLLEDLLAHAQGVTKCLGDTPTTTGQRAAAVSFAFNIGVGGFCKSSFARKLRARDPSACAELDKYIHAGGKVLPGLVKRRAAERAICEGGPK